MSALTPLPSGLAIFMSLFLKLGQVADNAIVACMYGVCESGNVSQKY